MTANDRFTDYATSGALSVTLSRRQVTALADIATTGNTDAAFNSLSALHGKGLVEPELPGGPGTDYVLTAAGRRALELTVLAGLTNATAMPIETELEETRAALAMTAEQNRRMAHDLLDNARRIQTMQQIIERLSRQIEEGGGKSQLILSGDFERPLTEAVEEALSLVARQEPTL